jgi:Kef-type K+ transport system membrane component KefB/nucleotide-binding universal stress UspA family protein
LGEIGFVLALGALLAVGFALARIAKLVHLPSVTGYIAAGIALGPSGFGLIGADVLENRLQVFTHIALMLVAFAIGERFDLRELASSAHTLIRVGACECSATFTLVAVGVGVIAYVTGAGGQEAAIAHAVAIGLICAAIGVATAPAATVVVMRELGARGPLSRLVLSDVVVNNALSVSLFGVMVAAARVLLGTAGQTAFAQILAPVSETVLSLAFGIAVGLTCDYIVHRLTARDDVLIVSLAAVLLIGGLAEAIGLSSLLAGVAAGFAVVNRDRRDVRAFRALNDFEPPIYGIFFALAGAQLHMQELLSAGALGAAFVMMRAAGKYFGAWLGGRVAGVEPRQASSLGLGLLPQAGLAIGLAYLVREDPTLAPIQTVVITLVTTSVVINELIGAPLVRLAVIRAGEASTPDQAVAAAFQQPEPESADREAEDEVQVAAWPQKQLEPPERMNGCALIGIARPASVRALTRLGTLLGHYYGANPMAVHVVAPEEEDYWKEVGDQQTIGAFRTAMNEAYTLGYKLHTEIETDEEVAQGILRTAHDHNAQAIVLGHPPGHRSQRFPGIVEGVARAADCPVVVAKFAGPLAGGRILVPLTEAQDLDVVRPLVRALGVVAEHTITLLRLVPPECREAELREAEQQVEGWCISRPMAGELSIRAVAAESRLHQILEAAQEHDVLAMAVHSQGGLRQAFFGSVAREVAEQVDRTMLFVHGAPQTCTLDSVQPQQRAAGSPD